MIGDGWTDNDESRSRETRADKDNPRRIAVVTGTRAEFGLLCPVMDAIQDRSDCELLVIAAGSHLIQPAITFREVKARYDVADSIPMQTVGRVGREHDVEALGRGVSRFGRSFERLRPEWVVVLGDRIEAFAAASAASVGGFALAHIHGGDRAEGVADEAMRHAITKLAHLHFAATQTSAERIERMGEDPTRVINAGSPAVDALASVAPMSDAVYKELGSPEMVLLWHPCGRPDEHEEHDTNTVLAAIGDTPTLALHPNLDPGRAGIMRALTDAPGNVTIKDHLPRDQYVALLKRLGESGGALVGNSSSGLIEATALGCPSVDIGDRQRGRERSGDWVEHAPCAERAVCDAIDRATTVRARSRTHPYGDGRAGVRIAETLALRDPSGAAVLRKLNAY